MFWTRLVISIAEFTLSLGLSIFVVFWSYKSFVRANDSYDAEAEIRKGNTAVAILIAALTFSAALVMRETIYPVVSILTLGLTGEEEAAHGVLTLLAYAIYRLDPVFIIGQSAGVFIYARNLYFIYRHPERIAHT